MTSFGDIKAATDWATSIIRNINSREAEEALLRLSQMVNDIYGDFMNERDARLRAEERLSQLERSQTDCPGLILGGEAYWRALSDGDFDGPFCTYCFENEAKTFRLNAMPKGKSEFGSHMCPHCWNTMSPKKPSS